MKVAPLYLFVLLAWGLFTPAWAADKPFAELEREAKEVLALADNIQERKRIGVVFAES